MSYHSELALQQLEESGLNELLSHLIETEEITGVEAGISRQIISKGLSSLTKKQAYVFNKNIDNIYRTECELRGEIRSWDEILDGLLDDHSMCFSCIHDLNKLDAA